MKKYYTSDKFKKSVSRRQLRQLKSSRRHAAWLKSKRKGELGRSRNFLSFRKAVETSYEIIVPRNFVLSANVNEVLNFITRVKNISKVHKRIFIKLRDVENITHGTIAMLLSVIGELKELGVYVSGDYPRKKDVRKILEQSGFFNHVNGLIDDENKVTINTILTKGKEVVDSEETAPIVTTAMKTVFGESYRNQPLQGLLVELMANTVNHAFPEMKNRRWWLSVNHDLEKNKVSFAFVDNGAGIIKTLFLKFRQKIEIMFISGNPELLNSAFMGKVGSRTKLGNRGRGLPSIYKKYSKKNIRRLAVITNDVLLDFDENKIVQLTSSFNGTYYYWELDLNCTAWKNY